MIDQQTRIALQEELEAVKARRDEVHAEVQAAREAHDVAYDRYVELAELAIAMERVLNFERQENIADKFRTFGEG